MSNTNESTSPAPFTTQVFEPLRQMQDEIQRQNKAMGWYDGMESKYSQSVIQAESALHSDGYHDLAEEIKNLHADYERLMRERLFSNCCMNIVGEVAEMFESYRSGTLNKECDKADKMRANNLPVLTAEQEEIADIVIRALDYAGRFNVDIARAVEGKHLFNRTRGHRHGGKKA
jgi:hypothetical protein